MKMNRINKICLSLAGTIIAMNMIACSDKEQQTRQMPPQEVFVAKPIIEDVEYWDNFSAKLNAIELVELRSRIGGYLEKITFKEGQNVNKDDLLFVIDPRECQAALLAAKARVKEVEARLSLANTNHKRAKELYEAKAISKEILDTRESEVLSAEASMLLAQAQLKEAELNLEYTHIRSPISGKVGHKNVDAGNLVNANDTLLTTIVNSDIIQAYFEISERDSIRYKENGLFKGIDTKNQKGPKVFIKLFDSDKQIEGMLTYFDNKLGENTSSLTLRANFDNKDRLLSSGMFATISVLSNIEKDAMLIPEASIGTDLVNRYVLVVNKDNVVEFRPVKIGRMIGNLRVIESGISPEDKVVKIGLQRAIPNATVAPKEVSFKD